MSPPSALLEPGSPPRYSNYHKKQTKELPLDSIPVECVMNLDENSNPSPEPGLLHRSLLSKPLEVVSALGTYLTLSSGKLVLDGCAGAAVATIGHAHPEIQKAIAEQAAKVSYVHTLTYTTASAEDLANFMVEQARPFGLTRAYFVGSGSEAMDSAMKLARQFFFEKGEKQRVRFVSRKQGYHGNTIGAMSISHYVARRVPYEGALLLDGVSFVSPAYPYRGQRVGEDESIFAQRLVSELDEEFQRVGPETVIAFVAETVVGATTGCVTPPAGYFEGVRKVCDKYGILLILDEIMCGSGRTGTYFAFEQEKENVIPDIITVGKGLGAGYAPIGGILIHSKIVEVLRLGSGSFNHGHTYQAHPTSCAAALAVQKIIKRENLVERSAVMGRLLVRLLKDTLGDCKYVGEIRGRGLFRGLEFVADRETKAPFPPSVDFGFKIQQKALELGLAVYPGKGTADGVAGDHIILAPPLNIQEEDLRKMVRLLKEAYDLVEAMVDA
ncbi:Fc.00g069640.m01.CDS01 [Cosmosporella sp. VM-42]